MAAGAGGGTRGQTTRDASRHAGAGDRRVAGGGGLRGRESRPVRRPRPGTKRELRPTPGQPRLHRGRRRAAQPEFSRRPDAADVDQRRPEPDHRRCRDHDRPLVRAPGDSARRAGNGQPGHPVWAAFRLRRRRGAERRHRPVRQEPAAADGIGGCRWRPDHGRHDRLGSARPGRESRAHRRQHVPIRHVGWACDPDDRQSAGARRRRGAQDVPHGARRDLRVRRRRRRSTASSWCTSKVA